MNHARPPAPGVLERLRDGKRELRAKRMHMSLPEKVEQVVKLQEANLPMIRRRRPLKDYERVWPTRHQ